METRLLSNQILIGCLLLALLAGCATAAPETATLEPTSKPMVPTSTHGPGSCREVGGNCLELSFDGENCTYTGPTALKTGTVTLIFLNESEGRAAVNLVRHLGDQTIQDMIDLIGEEPSPGHAPSWANPVNTWQIIRSGETYAWEGALKAGIHTMVCADPQRGVWHGAGFTVED